jgi:hypothetical protein
MAINTELSKIERLSVVAPELIENVARRKALDPIEAARELGAARFVAGSFAVFEGSIRIDARVVDSETGHQTSAGSIEGRREQFFQLQRDIALATLRSLAVELAEQEQAALGETLGTDVDSYRKLMEVEGMMPPAGASPAGPAGEEDRQGRRWQLVESAYAAEAGAAEEPVHALLEAYRGAFEDRDVEGLARLYSSFSPALLEALRSYFATVRDLKVEFRDVQVVKREGAVALSFIRRDRFVAQATGELQTLELRVTKLLNRVDGVWRFTGPNDLAAWDILAVAEARNRLASWTDRRLRGTAEVRHGESITRVYEGTILERIDAAGSYHIRVDIHSPADVSDTVLLRSSWPDGREVEWMWSRFTGRARRLPTGDGAYFETSVGPELHTRDIERINRLLRATPADAEARVVSEERIEGESAIVLEVAPGRAENPHLRYRLWLRESDLLVRRVDMIDPSDRVVKRVVFRRVESRAGGKVPLEFEVERPLAGERVVVRLEEAQVDGGVPLKAFSLQHLMRGR